LLRLGRRLLRRLAVEKIADRRGDLLHVRLEREMAGVVEADLGVRNVALKSLGAGRKKGSLLPHTASSGGRFWRKYSWNPA
jgi:hypothetical protein